MKYFCFILLLAISIASCNSGNSLKNVGSIEISGVTGVEGCCLDNMIEEARVIALETNDSSIILNPEEIVVNSSNIYVRDGYQNGGVAIFDINGKFVRRLQNGPAPFEIGKARSIYYDETSDCLYVYDNSGMKIMKYTHDGIFVSSTTCEIYALSIAAHNGKMFFASIWNKGNSELEIIETDSLVNITNKTSLGKQAYPDEILMRYFYSKGDSILISKPWDNKIYCYFNGEYKYEELTDDNNTINYSNFDDSFSMIFSLDKEQIVFKGVHFCSNNWQLFSVYGNFYATFLFRNQNSGQLLLLKHSPNSLCNMIRIMTTQDAKEQNIVGMISPEHLVNSSDNPDLTWDGSNPNNLISPDDMEKLKNVKPDDNPIIVLFKLKDE